MKHCYTIINKCLKLVNTLTLKHKQQIILKSKTETKNNKNSQVIRETAMVSHGFSSHSPLQPTDHTSFLHHAQHQISSVAQSCLTLQAHGLQHGNQFITNSGSLLRPHVQWVSDAIQPSHPLSSPSPPAFNISQHQGLFKMSQFFTSGGQSIGVSASASVLSKNIQDLFPLR